MGFHFVVSIYFRTTSLYLTISQQITQHQLFQIPQRYRFSSKSQRQSRATFTYRCCFRYHKGTDFQANHNSSNYLILQRKVVLDTTKVQIFKQITTASLTDTIQPMLFQIPQRYRFSSKSQLIMRFLSVKLLLFQIPQRYRFSSKSQPITLRMNLVLCCFRYHKGTDFQANHNCSSFSSFVLPVVLDTTKVQIFKQITTHPALGKARLSCFRYHKGTDFQANHNVIGMSAIYAKLFQIPQRYRFSSKSQLLCLLPLSLRSCFRYHKGTDFQANHNR